ncbi:hypothetical protein ABTW95_33760 [Spirillospora sp. NPDC127506]
MTTDVEIETLEALARVGHPHNSAPSESLSLSSLCEQHNANGMSALLSVTRMLSQGVSKRELRGLPAQLDRVRSKAELSIDSEDDGRTVELTLLAPYQSDRVQLGLGWQRAVVEQVYADWREQRVIVPAPAGASKSRLLIVIDEAHTCRSESELYHAMTSVQAYLNVARGRTSPSFHSVTLRIRVNMLVTRLRSLANYIRAVLEMARMQHFRELASAGRESSAAPLYLLLLAVYHRYGRRAEPSRSAPSLSRFQTSAGSALVGC